MIYLVFHYSINYVLTLYTVYSEHIWVEHRYVKCS